MFIEKERENKLEKDFKVIMVGFFFFPELTKFSNQHIQEI